MTSLLAWILALIACIASFAHADRVVECDVCIYGGTSGGVSAAVQASRMGKKVIIAEPGKHLGGMTAGGLSAVDIGDPVLVTSQSAATAAALAIDGATSVQKVDPLKLQERLRKDGQVLNPRVKTGTEKKPRMDTNERE